MLPIFGEDHISKLHSKNECQTYLWSYIAAKKLISKNKKQFVRLNDDLFHMLYESKIYNKLSTQNPNVFGSIGTVRPQSLIDRKVIVQIFEKHLEPYSAIIVRGSNEQVKYKGGMPGKIKIFADKRQGRKFMTHVLGLEIYSIEYKDFANQARKQFACSTSIQDLTGKAAMMKGGYIKKEVLIQGNVCSDVSTKILSKVYGIDSRFVDCNLAVTKQGKK